MRKLLTVVMATALFAGIANVNAMTESELQSKLTSTYTINGNKVSLTSSEKALVERYLKAEDISSTDADYIASKIDEAINILKNSGEDVSNFKKLSASTKDKLKALVSDVSANTSVKATVVGGEVRIYDSNGKLFAEISSLVKQTGASYTVAVIASIITILGAALVLVEAKRAN